MWHVSYVMAIQLVLSALCIVMASVPFVMMRHAMKNKRRLHNVLFESRAKAKLFYSTWVGANFLSFLSLLGAAVAIWTNFLMFVGLIALPVIMTTLLLRREEISILSKVSRG